MHLQGPRLHFQGRIEYCFFRNRLHVWNVYTACILECFLANICTYALYSYGIIRCDSKMKDFHWFVDIQSNFQPILFSEINSNDANVCILEMMLTMAQFSGSTWVLIFRKRLYLSNAYTGWFKNIKTQMICWSWSHSHM